MSINYFDSICYINLDHRVDRKILILDQLKKLEIDPQKIVRISACSNFLNGYKGGVLSHIKALDYAIDKNLNNVLILEDDCIFTKSKIITDRLILYFFEKNIKWDVFFLGGKFFIKRKINIPHVIKILKSSDAHAYAVNKNYMKILKQCFLSCYNLVKNEVFYSQSWQTKTSIFDIYWNNLQKKDNWYALDTQLAIQNASFSDNTKKQRNYLKELKKI